MSTTINITALSKTFPAIGAAGISTAVDNVSLSIPAGELFFLLGPSGCGKTTLLRMIAGFIDPTKGTIGFVENGSSRDVTHTPPNQRNTGMVFQSYALWPHMTVADNVAFGLSVRKVAKAETQSRVMEALKAVQMDQYAARKPTQLSGGQQQRVALARALVIRPSVLLLDEPLSNLDAKLRNDLRSEIRRICKQSGLTTIYVTHDQKEALSMADRIAIMRSGKIVQIGTPGEMYRRPANKFVAEFLGETNLVEAKVISATPEVINLETPSGTMTSRAHAPLVYGGEDADAAPDSRPAPKSAAPAAPLPAQGSRVLLSLRPEALRLIPSWAPAGENALPAKVLETTFLGEVAQHLVELKGGTKLRLAQLNPAGAALARPSGPGPTTPQRGGSRVEVAPEDVVLLPAE
jgi:iron(III) transport system ATP-binding protein